MAALADLATLVARPVLQVAPRLLGGVLTHDGVAVRLTEVEAYGGPDDPGSHAFRGQTARNAVMFGPPGRLYVYFTYGMHYCANLVCGPDGTPSAVLLRAGEIVAGEEVARSRRGTARDRDLARGPARLCQALGLGAAQNGAPVTEAPLTLTLASPAGPAGADPHRTARGLAPRSGAAVAVLVGRRAHRVAVPSGGGADHASPS